jgi:hypothetical protein
LAHAVPAIGVRRGVSANRSFARAQIRQPRQNQSDRADDVAVVPADAYEYRH